LSWNDVGTGGGGAFLKLSDGQKVKLHVLSDEPYSFRQVFNRAIQKSAIVGEDFAQAGVQVKMQHAFAVYLVDTKEVKVWICGNQVAGEIKNIYDNYGGLNDVDLIVTRKGTELKTKYPIVPVPVKVAVDASELEIPNLEEMFPLSEDAVVEEVCGEADAMPEPEAEPEAAAPEPEPEAEPEAEAAPEPEPEEEAPAPLPPKKPLAGKPPAKPAAVPAKAGALDKATLMKQATHLFATKPKFRDMKIKLAAVKAASKSKQYPTGKTILSQLSAEELQKLVATIK